MQIAENQANTYSTQKIFIYHTNDIFNFWGVGETGAVHKTAKNSIGCNVCLAYTSGYQCFIKYGR
jgi:hypothetical protein